MERLHQAQAIAAKPVIELSDLNQLDQLIGQAKGAEADRIGDLVEAAMQSASEDVLEMYFEQSVTDAEVE